MSTFWRFATLLGATLFLIACGDGRFEISTPASHTADPAPAGTVEQKADSSLPPYVPPAAPVGDTEPEEIDDSHLEALFNVYELDYLDGLPNGEEQRDSLCSRGFADKLSRWFCGSPGGTASNLDDLLVALELKELGASTPKKFAATGHSTSLVSRRTSSINPRVVYFPSGEVGRGDDWVTAGFVRGDFFVEVAAWDPSRDEMNLYLVKAEKPCEPDCTHADRFLPQSEIGWESITVYAAEDLQNTALDCLGCHQPGGPGMPRMLRMQELVIPWTHWFEPDFASRALLDQFRLAHDGDERYGTIPVSRFDESDPAALEAFIRAVGYGEQPNMYDGAIINADLPDMTTPTPMWRDLYDAAVAGAAISPPYFGIDPFDRDAIIEKVSAYRAVVSGDAPRSSMPDLNDVFRDDAHDELGFEPAEGLDAKGIVMHRCGSCHTDRGTDLSRDNFVATDFPDRLTERQKDAVANRIRLGKSSLLRMPPTLFSDLAPEHIDTVLRAIDRQ